MPGGGVITTGAAPRTLWPGVHAIWGQRYDEHPKEYTDLYAENESDQAYEVDVQITDFGLGSAKSEGGTMSYAYSGQGPVSYYVHITYGIGYIVTMEEQLDNLYEVVSRDRAWGNAFSTNTTIETLAALVYNDAFTGQFYLNANGQTLCSTSQPNTTGGSYSNSMALDLMEASIEDGCTLAEGFLSDSGNPIKAIPQTLHVHYSQQWEAARILKSALQNDTANNAINALLLLGNLPQGVKVSHYFSNQNAWFMRTNVPKGMQMFWRMRPDFDMDSDFNTKNLLQGTIWRVAFGNSDPRGIIGSNGP